MPLKNGVSQGKAQPHLSPRVRQTGPRNTAVNQNNEPLCRHSLEWGGGSPPKTLPAGDSGKVPVLESTEH